MRGHAQRIRRASGSSASRARQQGSLASARAPPRAARRCAAPRAPVPVDRVQLAPALVLRHGVLGRVEDHATLAVFQVVQQRVDLREPLLRARARAPRRACGGYGRGYAGGGGHRRAAAAARGSRPAVPAGEAGRRRPAQQAQDDRHRHAPSPPTQRVRAAARKGGSAGARPHGACLSADEDNFAAVDGSRTAGRAAAAAAGAAAAHHRVVGAVGAAAVAAAVAAVVQLVEATNACSGRRRRRAAVGRRLLLTLVRELDNAGGARAHAGDGEDVALADQRVEQRALARACGVASARSGGEGGGGG